MYLRSAILLWGNKRKGLLPWWGSALVRNTDPPTMGDYNIGLSELPSTS
jgi:hypothetical protein